MSDVKPSKAEQLAGGVSAPTSPPAAPAVAGEQYSQHRITTGGYRIAAASIHSANAFDEECRISLVHIDANDAETEACLASGVVSQNKPFCLPSNRIVSGPGYLRAYVENLGATAFTFVVILDKLVEAKARSIGGFGSWF